VSIHAVLICEAFLRIRTGVWSGLFALSYRAHHPFCWCEQRCECDSGDADLEEATMQSA